MKAIRSIIFILVCVGLIWLFVLLIANAFRGSNSTTPQPTEDLASYSTTDAVTEMYVDGPIIINQDHNAIRITVDRQESKIETLIGYDGQVLESRSYPNTAESYRSFLSALDVLGFGRGGVKNNDPLEAGTCPSGSRYVFRLMNGSDVRRSWTTSCGGGNYAGRSSQTRSLFIKQIPEKDYSELTRSLNTNTL
jgi:hypothetical protein